MQVRRVVTAYMITLALCLLIVAGRTERAATLTGQAPPPADNAQIALAPPEPEAPTVGVTQDPVRQVRLDLVAEDIPFTALAAYRRAAAIMAQVAPDCGLRWTLLAAIGRVESRHGQTVGATLEPDGMSRPASDPTTNGVGPMRFLPSVWKVVAVDGDGDGRRTPEDIDDAALAAAVYLCAEGADLRTRSGMAAAVRGYSDSKRYVALVLGYEKLYREGDFLVIAASGEVAPASIVLAGPRLEATPFSRPFPSQRARARIRAEARETMARAAQPGATAGPATPPPSPSARPSSDAKVSPPTDDPQPSSPPASQQNVPEGEQPTDGAADASDTPNATPDTGQPTDPGPDTGQPTDPDPGPDTGQPTDPGPATGQPTDPGPATGQPTDPGPATGQPTDAAPDAPGTPSPAKPETPQKPESPNGPGTGPDACTPDGSDAGGSSSTEGQQTAGNEGAADGAGADRGASGDRDAAAACPDPDPAPCRRPDDSARADAGPDNGQTADRAGVPSGPPHSGTCERRPETSQGQDNGP